MIDSRCALGRFRDAGARGYSLEVADGTWLEDRYWLGEELGRGAFGRVLRASALLDGAEVAVKLPHGEVPAGVEARIRREAALLRGLEHPHLARLLDALPARAGGLALVYELVPGLPLDRVLAEGPVGPARALAWIRELASALDALAEGGLTHRDLKPANVMVRPDDHLTLLDFGLARADEAGYTLTGEGAIMGTPAYMSPEAFRGERVGPAADRYALACLAQELLAGEPPFAGDLASLARAHLSEPPPRASRSRPGLPPAVDAALARGLAKSADQRHPSAAALADALELALGGDQGTEAATRGLAAGATRLEVASEPGPGSARSSSTRAVAPVGSPRRPVGVASSTAVPGSRRRARLLLGSALVAALLMGYLLRGGRKEGASGPELVKEAPVAALAPLAVLAPVGADLLPRVAAELDGIPDTLRGVAGRWASLLPGMGATRELLEALAAVSDPEDLPEEWRREVLELGDRAVEKLLPHPFLPFLSRPPLEARWAGVPEGVGRELERQMVAPPESLTGWMETAYQLAGELEALLPHVVQYRSGLVRSRVTLGQEREELQEPGERQRKQAAAVLEEFFEGPDPLKEPELSRWHRIDHAELGSDPSQVVFLRDDILLRVRLLLVAAFRALREGEPDDALRVSRLMALRSILRRFRTAEFIELPLEILYPGARERPAAALLAIDFLGEAVKGELSGLGDTRRGLDKLLLQVSLCDVALGDLPVGASPEARLQGLALRGAFGVARSLRRELEDFDDDKETSLGVEELEAARRRGHALIRKAAARYFQVVADPEAALSPGLRMEILDRMVSVLWKHPGVAPLTRAQLQVLGAEVARAREEALPGLRGRDDEGRAYKQLWSRDMDECEERIPVLAAPAPGG